MVVAREDLALEAAFWAQLPGNFGFRPRKAPITQSQFRGPGRVPQLSDRTGRGQSLGRGAGAVRDLGAFAVLLLAARERSARGGRRFAARHRAHVHLRTDRLGQDRVPRVLRGDAGEGRCHAGDLRQGSRARDPGAGAGRCVRAAQGRAADRLQSARACRIRRCSGSFCGCGCGRWSRGRGRRSRCARRRTSSRRCSARWRWSRRLRAGCRG